MKYLKYDIVFREHPRYINLAFQISNCPNRCVGCHTPELQGDVGTTLTFEEFKAILSKYVGLIGNVIFMGGDQYPEEIMKMLEHAHSVGIKTTLWTGCCNVDQKILSVLDYVKVGPYIPALGGLTSISTNQRYYEVSTGKDIVLK